MEKITFQAEDMGRKNCSVGKVTFSNLNILG